MNKNKIRIICFLIIALALAIPYIVISGMDYYAFSHIESMETSDLSKIIAAHPIVQEIYNDYYSTEAIQETNQYVIKNKDLYSSSEQQRITELQNLFSREIEKLMQYQVIDQDILETNSQEYPITFGTFEDRENPHLDQLFRMDKNYKDLSFTCEKDTEKILYISLMAD